jgi:hypothetical protein
MLVPFISHRPVARWLYGVGSVQSFSHIGFGLSGARHWFKR